MRLAQAAPLAVGLLRSASLAGEQAGHGRVKICLQLHGRGVEKESREVAFVVGGLRGRLVGIFFHLGNDFIDAGNDFGGLLGRGVLSTFIIIMKKLLH